MDVFDSVFVIFFLVILLAMLLGYLYLDRIFSYWERRGVPHLRPDSWVFGNTKCFIFGKENSAIVYDEIYRKFSDQPYCGFYEFQYPILLLRDPQLIQMVLVEKFNSFHDNKFSLGIKQSKNELFSNNPFVLTGSRWKEVRSILVLGLTGNRVKVVENIIKPAYKKLNKHLENNTDDIEVYDIAIKFTAEMVATFGWGISTDTISENAALKDLFIKPPLSVTSIDLQFTNPFLSYWLNARLFKKEFEVFLKHITEQCITMTENSKSSHPTFLQAILNARDKLKLSGKDMSLSEITGHLSTFYLDGHETTSTTLSVIIYCLMLHSDVQQRLREEIFEVSEEITVDSVNKLCYMEMVIAETMRLYSAIPNLTRICTDKCTLGNLEVEPGTRILVPSYSIHHDPKYYPDPECFNPENFSEENKNNRHKYTHFTFGQGPRICLGMKYATATIKLFLFHLLREYEIVPPTSHPVCQITPNPESIFFFSSKDPMYIKLKKLRL